MRARARRCARERRDRIRSIAGSPGESRDRRDRDGSSAATRRARPRRDRRGDGLCRRRADPAPGRHPHVEIVGLLGRDRDGDPIGGIHAHLAGTGLAVDARRCRTSMRSSSPSPTAPPPALVRGLRRAPARRSSTSGPTSGSATPPTTRAGTASSTRGPTSSTSRSTACPSSIAPSSSALVDAPVAIVGSPGCYPTATLLALAPLARAGLIGDLVVDAKSGVSGAGREAEARPDVRRGQREREGVRRRRPPPRRRDRAGARRIAAVPGSSATPTPASSRSTSCPTSSR